jgi:hypothetical protein
MSIFSSETHWMRQNFCSEVFCRLTVLDLLFEIVTQTFLSIMCFFKEEEDSYSYAHYYGENVRQDHRYAAVKVLHLYIIRQFLDPELFLYGSVFGFDTLAKSRKPDQILMQI